MSVLIVLPNSFGFTYAVNSLKKFKCVYAYV